MKKNIQDRLTNELLISETPQANKTFMTLNIPKRTPRQFEWAKTRKLRLKYVRQNHKICNINILSVKRNMMQFASVLFAAKKTFFSTNLYGCFFCRNLVPYRTGVAWGVRPSFLTFCFCVSAGKGVLYFLIFQKSFGDIRVRVFFNFTFVTQKRKEYMTVC